MNKRDLEVGTYTDRAGRTRIRIRSANANILLREAHGPGYRSASEARRMLRRVIAKLAAGEYRFTQEDA